MKNDPPLSENSTLIFLTAGLAKATDFVRHFDLQTNIIVGISSAICLFSLSSIADSSLKAPLFILGIFSALSTLVGLYSIHPPRLMRKLGQEESLLYNRHATSFATPEEYAAAILAKTNTSNNAARELALEIYNLYKYYYRPKRRLFYIARHLLIVGVALSLLALFASHDIPTFLRM